MIIHNEKELLNDLKMLEGNLVRMRQTKELSELFNHYTFAHIRLSAIFVYLESKINNKEK
jgi:hypothetical protein